MEKLFTVVTVAYNEESRITQTIESVLRQKKPNYEYIIVEGASSDGTLQIAKGYEQKFSERKIPYYVFSEKDKGIYDAMNKAATWATGKLIIYINSGDEMFDENVLSNVEKTVASVPNKNVYFGKTLICENGYCRERKNGSIEGMVKHLPFCHQSAFTSRELLLKYKFSLEFQIAADYDLFLRMYLDNKEFQEIDEMISYFEMDGISSIQKKKMRKEYANIRVKMKVASVNAIMVDDLVNIFFDFKSSVAKKILKNRYYSEDRGWSKYPAKESL